MARKTAKQSAAPTAAASTPVSAAPAQNTAGEVVAMDETNDAQQVEATMAADTLKDKTPTAAAPATELKSSTVDKNDTLEYDLGNLAAFDYVELDSALLYTKGQAGREQYLREISRENVQLMVNHLFSLPSRPVPGNDTGRLVTLPTPITLLPREKPLPTPKAPTKWELFAKQKGITKKGKRDRLVYDEGTDSYKPRYGYQKANDPSQPVIMEHSRAEEMEDGTVVDPWTRIENEKRERRQKNKKQQDHNLSNANPQNQIIASNNKFAAASGSRAPGTLDLTSVQSSAVPRISKSAKITNNTSAGKSLHHVDAAMAVAERSTASMGKFDKTTPEGRSRNRLEPSLKKAKTAANSAPATENTSAEKQQAMNVLKGIFGRDEVHKEAESLDVNKAVRQLKHTGDEKNRRHKQKR